MQRIKTGDMVVVTTGKDRGKRGKVLKVLKNFRVLVEGVNLVKKHVKPNPHKQQEGGIFAREAGIHQSNLALYNAATGKGSRVGYRILDDKTKVRYFKDNDEVIDV